LPRLNHWPKLSPYSSARCLFLNRSMLFVTGLLFVLASTAPAQDVRYNYARGIDFRKFKIYKWLPLGRAGQVAELTDEQIKSALKTEFAKKGLTEVDKDDADLFIGYQMALGNESNSLRAIATGGMDRVGTETDGMAILEGR